MVWQPKNWEYSKDDDKFMLVKDNVRELIEPPYPDIPAEMPRVVLEQDSSTLALVDLFSPE